MNKINIALLYILLLISFIITNASSEPLDAIMVSKDNTDEKIYEIDKDVESGLKNASSPEEQVRYLKSVICDNQKKLENNNRCKSSAIRLLGKYGGTNSIPVLIDNLTFEDSEWHDFPSVIALAAIGETAVSPLLEVIKNEADKNRLAFAVQALMRIKGTSYNEFAKQQKQSMPSNTWKNLFRYAIKD